MQTLWSTFHIIIILHLILLYKVALLQDVTTEFTAHFSYEFWVVPIGVVVVGTVVLVGALNYKCLCLAICTLGHSWTQTVFHKKSLLRLVKYMNG